MANILDFTGVTDETIVITSKTGREFILRDDVPVAVYMAMVESQIRNQELQDAMKDKPYESARQALEEMRKNLDLLRKIFAGNGYELTSEELAGEFDLKAQQRILNVFFNSPARGLSGTRMLVAMSDPDAGRK